MRYFKPDGTEVTDQVTVAKLDLTDDSDDGYTVEPEFVRLCEEGDDEFPWVLDAVDLTGRFTELCWTYATEAEAVEAIGEFVAAASYLTWVGADVPLDPRYTHPGQDPRH